MERKFSRKRRLLSLLLAAVMLFAMAPVDALAAGAEDTGSFVNGPYLMTPKTDAMAVVWELDKAMKATITYGTTADNQKTVDVPVEEGEKYQGEPMHMYRARLTGLTPGTAYTYKVALENGQTSLGTGQGDESHDYVRYDCGRPENSGCSGRRRRKISGRADAYVSRTADRSDPRHGIYLQGCARKRTDPGRAFPHAARKSRRGTLCRCQRQPPL